MPKQCLGDCERTVYGKDYCRDCFEEKVEQETLKGQENRIRHEEELGAIKID